MDLVIRVVITSVFGTGLAFLIPYVLQEIVNLKSKQRDQAAIQLEFSILQKIILILLHTALYGLAAYYIALPTLLFVMVFITLAFLGTIIDFYMRIIPNELVLCLLGAGLLYRIFDGGFSSLLGSLGATLITIFVFGLSAGVTYLRKQTIGVGAGDIKLALAISIALGFPTIFYFYMAFAIAVIGYILISTRLRLSSSWQTYLPMAAPILLAFIAALFWQPLAHLLGMT